MEEKELDFAKDIIITYLDKYHSKDAICNLKLVKLSKEALLNSVISFKNIFEIAEKQLREELNENE